VEVRLAACVYESFGVMHPVDWQISRLHNLLWKSDIDSGALQDILGRSFPSGSDSVGADVDAKGGRRMEERFIDAAMSVSASMLV